MLDGGEPGPIGGEAPSGYPTGAESASALMSKVESDLIFVIVLSGIARCPFIGRSATGEEAKQCKIKDE